MRTVVGLRRPLFKSANLDAQQAIRSEALRDILRAGGVTAALGAGFRGLMGLRDILGYRRRLKDKHYLGPSVLAVPVPVRPSVQDKEKVQAPMLDKSGGYKKASEPTTRMGLWWYLPGMVLAGATGTAGGYKLMDALIHQKRKLDLKSEIENARDKYYRAVLQQYDPNFVPKAEAVPDYPLPKKTENKPTISKSIKLASLDADLEDLCAEVDKVLEKRALSEWAGKALGIYGALATLLALGAGSVAYDAARSRSTAKMMENAIQQREVERLMRRPPEIHAIPTPIKIVPPVKSPSDDDGKKMFPGE